MTINNYIQKLPIYLMVSIVLISCNNETHQEEDSITVRLRSEPERINPILFPNATARQVYQYIFLPLADYNPQTLILEPILIKKIPDAIPNGKGISYDLEILEDAAWEDGKPVTAQDYLFTVKAAVIPSSRANAYAGVLKTISNISIDKNDPKKLSVSFDHDFILSKETAINFEILPKHIYDPEGKLDHLSFEDILQLVEGKSEIDTLATSFGNDFNSIVYSRQKISGAGPYQFNSWAANEQIILKRKENYWGAKSELSALQATPTEIHFKIIPDENNALSQLQNGQIDVLPQVSNVVFTQLDSSEQTIQKLSPESTKYYYFILNTSSIKLQSTAVRKALACLTDSKKYIDLFENGLALRLRSFVPPNKYGENTSIEPYDYNLQTAKNILEGDGWRDSNNNGILDKMIGGNKVELQLKLYASGNLSKNIALLFSDACKQAGIDVEVIQKRFSIIRADHLRKGDFDIIPALASLDLNFDDPYDRFHSDNAHWGGSNYSGYQNSEVDSLINIIRSTKSSGQRMKEYYALQSIIKEDNPYIYLYAPREKILINQKWNGIGSKKRPSYFVNTFTLK